MNPSKAKVFFQNCNIWVTGKKIEKCSLRENHIFVQRRKTSYLLQTIDSLLSNHGTNASFGILIFVGETNSTFVKEICQLLWKAFAYDIMKGLIQVMSKMIVYCFYFISIFILLT